MTTTAQPGWYDDPNDAQAVRYWDGADWTTHRQRKPSPEFAAPSPARPQPSPQQFPRPHPSQSAASSPAVPARRRLNTRDVAIVGVALALVVSLIVFYRGPIEARLFHTGESASAGSSSAPAPSAAPLVSGTASPDSSAASSGPAASGSTTAVASARPIAGQFKLVINGVVTQSGGHVVCTAHDNRVIITTDGELYGAVLTTDDPPQVDSATFGAGDGSRSPMKYTRGDPGNAEAIRDGDAFDITGTANTSGDGLQPFELALTCPTGESSSTADASSSTKLVVAGQLQPIHGVPYCHTSGDTLKFFIAESVQNDVAVELNKSTMSVDSYHIRLFDAATAGQQGARVQLEGPDSNEQATATRNGNDYKVTSTISGDDTGTDGTHPVLPFEIEFSCP